MRFARIVKRWLVSSPIWVFSKHLPLKRRFAPSVCVRSGDRGSVHHIVTCEKDGQTLSSLSPPSILAMFLLLSKDVLDSFSVLNSYGDAGFSLLAGNDGAVGDAAKEATYSCKRG